MAYRSSRLQTWGSMVTRNLFQHSKHFYRYGIHVLQNAHGFMLIKLILEVRKAKIDWLQARLAVNPTKGDFRKDSNCHS